MFRLAATPPFIRLLKGTLHQDGIWAFITALKSATPFAARWSVSLFLEFVMKLVEARAGWTLRPPFEFAEHSDTAKAIH
ncbi:hypothetical protein F4780DRAFT_762512 [Xylariomycetidae sp. FL0641]|nr:hypothetical protein F4780DRAFT_762512 [Xylariomycetidae sp. FL0641]